MPKTRYVVRHRLRLQKLRREYRKQQGTYKTTYLAKVNGSVRLPNGLFWVHDPTGTDANGNITFGAPRKMPMLPGAAILPRPDTKVDVVTRNGIDYIARSNAQELASMGVDAHQTNTLDPAAQYKAVEWLLNLQGYKTPGADSTHIVGSVYKKPDGTYDVFPTTGGYDFVTANVPSVDMQVVVCQWLDTDTNTITATVSSEVSRDTDLKHLANLATTVDLINECVALAPASHIGINAWRIYDDTTIAALDDNNKLADLRGIIGGAGGGASALDDLTDVDVSTTPPNDGEALVYDGGDSLWKPGAVASSVHTHAATDIASGTLAHERGGLEADVSAYNGLVKISGGATSVVTAPAGAIVGDTDAQTLTNKTLTTPTIGDLTNAQHNHQNAGGGGQLTDAALSAAVGIAKGGTGQTTQAAAFDALSPLTTKGDLIARNSTTNTRLAVGANNRVLVADSAQPTGLKWSDALLALTKVTSGAFGGQVRNESGATANEGDVGYLDYDTNYGIVYKTTTTTYFDPSRVCVVLTAGSNGSTIYVTQKASYVGVNYTGTAPNAGEFLVTSTTAGQAQRQTTMNPFVFAICLSVGSGGTVAAMLLTNTVTLPLDTTDDLVRVENHSNTVFTSTISGAPTATSVTYGAIASGAENVIVPTANTQLGKMRLWNTTRNSYRLISSVNTATNTITTVSSTDSWANGDSITISSQTVVGGSAFEYIDVDLSQTTEISPFARVLWLQVIHRDTVGGIASTGVHPFIAYSAAKNVNNFTPGTTSFTSYFFSIPVYEGVIAFRSAASGAGTKITALKVYGQSIAVP